MSHSFDWRCDACERPNQHDFPEATAVSTPGGESDAPEPARPTAPGEAPDGGAARRQSNELECGYCHHLQPMVTDGFTASGALKDPVEVCLACGSNRMYSQKDFNRTLGVAIVIVGAAFSPWTYGLSLVVCMGLDYGLYYFVPEVTVCYACDAIHRGFEHNPAHRAHDPLLAERFRREARQELGLEEPDTEADPSES